jgi:HlyD family secretion protein
MSETPNHFSELPGFDDTDDIEGEATRVEWIDVRARVSEDSGDDGPAEPPTDPGAALVTVAETIDEVWESGQYDGMPIPAPLFDGAQAGPDAPVESTRAEVGGSPAPTERALARDGNAQRPAELQTALARPLAAVVGAARRFRTSPYRWPVYLAALPLLLFAIPWNLYVIEPCSIRPTDRAIVRSEVRGVLAQVLVEEGSRVSAGQAIARVDDFDVKGQLAETEAEAVALRARLAQLQEGARPQELEEARAVLASARHELQYARREAQRAGRMFREKVLSRQKLEEARSRLEMARADLSRARAQLRLLEAGTRTEEIEIAEASLSKTEARLAHLQELADKHVIRAPIDGVVLTPRVRDRVRQRVEVGDEIMEIADASRMEVEVLVPEREVDRIDLGQPLKIKVQALPLTPFETEVGFISPVVEVLDGSRVVRVRGWIDNEENLLHSGQTGYGEIDTGPSNLLVLALRRVVRWVRVRFLI